MWGLKHRDAGTHNTWHHIASYHSTIFTLSVSRLRLGCVGFLGSVGTPSSIVIWKKHIVSQPLKLLPYHSRTGQKVTGKVDEIVSMSFIGIKRKVNKLDDNKWSISESIIPRNDVQCCNNFSVHLSAKQAAGQLYFLNLCITVPSDHTEGFVLRIRVF